MSQYRRNARRDANEREIIEALEKVGVEIYQRLPSDLLCWYRGRWRVLEVKTPRGTFTEAQKALRAEGKGEGIITVRTPMEAIRSMEAVRAPK